MLVNKGEKIILLQNPKTGGRFKAREKSNGFKEYLLQNYVEDGEVKKTVYPWHVMFHELKSWLGDDFKNWTIYVFVRNPYDRFVSSNNYKFKSTFGKTKAPTFDEMITEVELHPEVITEHKDKHVWYLPQSYWIGSGVRVLRYESLDDWRIICDLMGIYISEIRIKPSYPLTDTQKSRIKALYREDEQIFKMYGL